MRHSGLMDNLEVERRSLVEMVSTGTRPFSVGEPMTLHVAPLRSDRATSEWSVARLPTGGACTFDIVRGESSRGAGLQEWRSQSVPRSRAVTPRTNRGYVLGAIAAPRPPRPPERAERPTVLRQVQDCKFPKVNCEARKGRV